MFARPVDGGQRDFGSLSRLLQRSRRDDYKLAHETITYVKRGTKEEPEVIAIRHHSTDILLYNKDGSIEVSTCHLCSSNTTRIRLRTYANIYLTNRKHAAINGFMVRPRADLFISHGWSDFVAWNGGRDDYVKLNPDKTWDMSTIKPHQVTFIVKPTEMRRAMRKVGMIARLALGMYKLSNDNIAIFQRRHDGPHNVDDWIMAQYYKPLNEIDLRRLPWIYATRDPHNEFKNAMDSVRWRIARYEGFVETRDVLTA